MSLRKLYTLPKIATMKILLNVLPAVATAAEADAIEARRNSGNPVFP
jgi:hypothetical protein